MQLVKNNDINFDKYLKGPQESADIKAASSYCQDVIDHFYGEPDALPVTLPWSKTHKYVQFRPGELSIWAGYNGSGKSLVLGQVAYDLIRQGETVVIASLEMSPRSTMVRMTRQATGVREPTISYIKALHEWTNEKLWIYDQQRSVKHDRMIAVARYCSQELGIKHIVIDSLMKCGIGVDDYNMQKTFINDLCVHAKDTGQHVHLVHHSRKTDNENKRVDKMDIKGAGEIADLADNIFLMWRNKPKEYTLAQEPNNEEVKTEPDAILSCAKQRHGEWEGGINLWFHPDSQQFVGQMDGGPFNTFDWSEPR